MTMPWGTMAYLKGNKILDKKNEGGLISLQKKYTA